MVRQQLDDLVMFVGASVMQRSVLFHVLRIHIGSVGQKHAANIEHTVLDSYV